MEAVLRFLSLSNLFWKNWKQQQLAQHFVSHNGYKATLHTIHRNKNFFT